MRHRSLSPLPQFAISPPGGAPPLSLSFLRRSYILNGTFQGKTPHFKKGAPNNYLWTDPWRARGVLATLCHRTTRRGRCPTTHTTTTLSLQAAARTAKRSAGRFQVPSRPPEWKLPVFFLPSDRVDDVIPFPPCPCGAMRARAEPNNGGQPELAVISSDVPNNNYCEDVTPPVITRSPDFQPEESTSTTSSKRCARMSGWKTSKFFSRTMSSGEILRGLKKLSLNAAAEDAARPRKSKSGQQLKKRSSEEEGGHQRQRSPGGFRPLSKAMSVSEPGSSSSQLGIVCKKEDLKAILAGLPPLNSSPSRRRGRRGAPSPLRHTKSASFETEGGRKEPVRRAGSSEDTPPRPTPLLLKPPPPRGVTVDTPKATPSSTDTVRNARNNRNSRRDVETSASTVKWDECEEVDAVALGDAIESFLRVSMGRRSTSLRRQRPHPPAERRAKSDG
ncbi:hypothetical protein JTE90_005220 [Oedothorax gibbosus]|uniref:Uncharacterized protein n=1 Tax=Oedothorax gibbosus TaxID=931172 RepID=A0AAV6UKD8_9ARAC|nr:hypothetical protein JTE90_005220 [Oedothorax gibbosus]